jgi:hypothetical protein
MIYENEQPGEQKRTIVDQNHQQLLTVKHLYI